MSNKAIANILDDLSDWVKEEGFGGEVGSGSNHGDGVNDWDGVKEGLSGNIPYGSDVAIFDIDGAKEKGNAKGKAVKFKNQNWDDEPG